MPGAVRAAFEGADSLREAIFARAVLLCEGPTDAALIEGVGDLQGGLDRDGVAVAACGGKATMIVGAAILKQLQIPFVALFDADGAKRRPSEAEKNKQLLALCGEQPTEFPERGVRERSANFEDCLETDLAALWPQFEKARDDVAQELGVPAEKNPRVYRQAAAGAGEPPEFLLDVLEAARRLAG